MIKNKKKRSGITLIALVVTVVVLLILAGVSINLVLGDNGIVNKAQEAEKISRTAGKKEKIEFILDDYKIQKEIEKISLEDYLKNNKILYDKNEENNNITVEYEGSSYTINRDNYEITDIKEVEKKQEVSLVESVTSDNYGDDVIGYEANGISEWQIFYNDGNNIYLISKDFADISKISEEQPQLTKGNNYRVRAGDFTGLYTDESQTKGRFEKALNDKDVWNKYYVNSLADYAIGGPTLEMIINSYNQKYNLNMSCAFDSNGYVIDYNDNTSKKLNSDDSLYVIKDTTKSWGYWIATRAKDNITASLYIVRSNGQIQADACWKDTAATRPIVCLKNSVKAAQYTSAWVLNQ